MKWRSSTFSESQEVHHRLGITSERSTHKLINMTNPVTTYPVTNQWLTSHLYIYIYYMNSVPFPSARKFIIALVSQANVAHTNSLMCSYSSSRRTISFRFSARATSISRRSPLYVLTRAQDFNHRSALETSFVATENINHLLLYVVVL